MLVHLCTHAGVCRCVHVGACVCPMCMSVHMHGCVQEQTHIRLHVWMCVHVHECACECVCVHACMHGCKFKLELTDRWCNHQPLG